MTFEEFIKKASEFGQPEERIKYCLAAFGRFVELYKKSVPGWDALPEQEKERVTADLFDKFELKGLVLQEYYPGVPASPKKAKK